MPAVDQCEPQIIRALAKAGWEVVDRPIAIRYTAHERLYADLRLRNQHNSQAMIVVEVKCFDSTRSQIEEFYQAVGQYLTYRAAMKLADFPESLWLAVPTQAYTRFFRRHLVRSVVEDARIALILVDLDREEVAQWIP